MNLNGYLCLLGIAASVLSSPGATRSPGNQVAFDGPTATATAEPPVELSPMQKGDILRAEGRYQASIEAYAQSPQLTAEIWNKIGISNEMMLNQKEAVRCYKKSLKLNPNDSEVLNNLGTLYETLGDFSRADREYQKALKVNPHAAVVYRNLGTNKIAQHDYEAARKNYELAMKIDPTIFTNKENPSIGNASKARDRGAMNYFLAVACVHNGQTDRALQYLRASINEGYVNSEKVAADRQFISLRNDPAFRQLLADQKQQ